jgi:hypothetical protein
MSIAGSVTTVLSVIGWPALVFCLFAAAVTRDLPKAAKAGFRGALLGLAVIVSYGVAPRIVGWLEARRDLPLQTDAQWGHAGRREDSVQRRRASVLSRKLPGARRNARHNWQALYLDPGPGRPPLIALLTHIRRDDEVAQNGHLYHYRWSGEAPSNVLADACLGGKPRLDRNGDTV